MEFGAGPGLNALSKNVNAFSLSSTSCFDLDQSSKDLSFLPGMCMCVVSCVMCLHLVGGGSTYGHVTPKVDTGVPPRSLFTLLIEEISLS